MTERLQTRRWLGGRGFVDVEGSIAETRETGHLEHQIVGRGAFAARDSKDRFGNGNKLVGYDSALMVGHCVRMPEKSCIEGAQKVIIVAQVLMTYLSVTGSLNILLVTVLINGL